MGTRQSVQVQSPLFVPQDWTYLPDQEGSHEDYGYFRTLQHVSTGQKIDEYEFIWENQQEFDYYLKSYNWRYKQSNVVSTKFIDIQNKNEFCSQTFMARVYIEHIRVRISQIYDIPYPQNLYVIMEALEGYSKIYQHSKFFFIEENQICVDQEGKVKIWVNGDLSINYPNTHGQELQGEGEEEMVDMLIKIIADNTDPESEPEMSFSQYYHKKKGLRGKNFQEAKVLVQSYARINGVQIPQKFEAILNSESQEVLQLKSFTDPSEFSKRSSNVYQNPQQNINQMRQNWQPMQNNSFFNQNMSFGNNNMSHPLMGSQGGTFGQNQPVIHHTNIIQTYYAQPVPQQIYPVYSNPYPQAHQIPQKIQQRQGMLPQLSFQQIPVQIQGSVPQHEPEYVIPSTFATKNSLNLSKPSEKQEIKKVTFVSDSQEERDKVFMEPKEQSRKEKELPRTFLSKTQKEEDKKEQRDLISRSLPIDPTLHKRPHFQLNKFVTTDKAVKSHIHSKESEVKGLKLNQLRTSSKRSETIRNSREQKLSLKYNTTLQHEFEIDPEIAADLAKYNIA